ncbi:pyridoxal 5'-phosphate synthase glutaminase subunit PdxT [Nesterenkonia sp. HG001]|uniref:pyridoxal 5'-phosphate synthase glutaminase subunit PdxT n=1 Tax=Nesterenkonia sp. HG001 TaxID=2983207 RepID=UPI002AC73024|nr:pyridoxal 5'-phosphate synthase glutaminase subunit PdxT [Nesterenkonia sp. HG001]MDZ5076276.1 pyridoxal 5'-phosphate synthase glutaminase subunit PdxT [Nesterenkonia sp. HG001]
MSPRIGVLALQGAVAEHAQALTASGAEVRTVRRPAELDALDGLVVPGGESTTMARLAAPVRMMEHIREAQHDGLALFGTCAGLILLAREVADPEALAGFPRIGGLDVVARRNGYGSQQDSFTEPLDIVGLEEPLEAVFIRAPVVEEVGAGVQVLAESRGIPVALRAGRMLATSFHPELTDDPRLHRLFVEIARDA